MYNHMLDPIKFDRNLANYVKRAELAALQALPAKYYDESREGFLRLIST